jgi:DNA-directed RNA polymerase subunit RPC12/RpoP
MDITCGDCGARFRLDRALLKDSSAARIRCRKCGGRIVVRLQEETSLPPAEEPPAPEKPPEKIAPRLEESAPPPPVEEASPQEPTAFETDISGMVRSEHEPETVDPVPPGKPGTIYSQIEDLFAYPPKEDAGPDRIPPSPEGYTAGETPPEETAVIGFGRKVPSRRSPITLKVLVISVSWILLLAGGTLYFGTTKSGQDMLGKLFAGWGSGRAVSAPEGPVYDIRDVKWHIDNNAAGGSLFVIRGSVANVGKVPSAGIRMQATLLGKDNEALAEKTAFAGNLLDEASLRLADRAGIEGVLSNRSGEGNVNRNIPAGKALPFMIVFTDPPEKVASFKVGAFDGE